VSSRRSSGDASTSSASARSIAATSASRKSIPRRQASTISRSSAGSSCTASQRRPATPNKVCRRRATLQVADQDRVHLVLLACALPHQLRPARDPSTQDTRLLLRRPDLGQKAGREQLRPRARVELVRLRRLRRVLDRLRVREHNTTDMRRDEPRDRQRVPPRLEHHLIIRSKAPGEQLKRRRRRLDSPSTAHPAALRDRDLAEIAVHTQRNEAHPYLLLNQRTRRRGGQNDNYGSVLTAHPGRRRGGQLQTNGLAAHSVSDGLPNLVSPFKPLSRNSLRH
jgi:hypothetical protein